METPVLVIGAGPTGLLLAAELRRRGVEATVVDARDEPAPWDRATVVHPRSLELLEPLGLAQPLLDVGVHQWGLRVFAAGEQLGEMDLGESNARFGFNLNVSEEVTERILLDHLLAQGGEVVRGHRVVGLEQDADAVTVTIETASGTEEVRAEWVVGCGGVHSPARTLTGIPFEGRDVPDWAVFDLTLEGWSRDHDVNYGFFDERPVLLTPLPERRWRAYVRPDGPDSDIVAETAAALAAYEPEVRLAGTSEPRRFDCHSRVAASYSHGRVLLAGDAAHACTPAQGHGMNSGIQDSFNLAWKLALVAGGRADPALLDSYEDERRPVAEAIVAAGDGAEEVQRPADRAARDQMLRELLASADSRRGELVAEVELDIDYSGSPIVRGSGGGRLGEDGETGSGLEAGMRVPAGGSVHAAGHEPGDLQDLNGASHTLALVGRDAEAVAEALRLSEELKHGQDLFERVAVLGEEQPATPPVGFIEPRLAGELGVERLTAFGLRPDGYVGLRADEPAAAAIGSYVELVLSGG